MNNQKINYYELIKETTILTVAIAIIASAVYLFLVPSQTSIDVYKRQLLYYSLTFFNQKIDIFSFYPL